MPTQKTVHEQLNFSVHPSFEEENIKRKIKTVFLLTVKYTGVFERTTKNYCRLLYDDLTDDKEQLLLLLQIEHGKAKYRKQKYYNIAKAIMAGEYDIQSVPIFDWEE